MAVTSGFYNSVSGDRKYNALQMSSIFDGIIEDGVYSTIGDHFSVTAGTGNTVIVGTGRAWFNHTWTLNDADYPVILEPSEVVLNRYDAIVIEVNGSNAVRGNSIKVIKGTPGSSPSKPSLAKGDNNIWQHPLAYVYVPAGSSSISQSNIEYVVGKSECPFVVAAVQSVNIDALVAQWQNEFDTWFDNLEIQLSGDVAGNLQNQINQKVDKGNVIDNLEDLVANQANGMIAGALAVSKLISNLSGIGQVAEVGNYGEWNLPTSVYYQIGNKTQVVNNAYYQTSTENSIITIKQAGIYLVTFNTKCVISSERGTIWTRLTKNNAEMETMQNNGNTGYIGVAYSKVVKLDAGDKINAYMSATGTIKSTGYDSLSVVRISA